MAQLIGTAPNQVPTNADLGSMAYQDATNYTTIAQQGLRNVIINGAFDIWQRGTSWGDGNNDFYAADRWHTQRYAANSYTISRQGTGGQAAGMPGFDYCMRLQRVPGSTAVTAYFMNQPIERINCQHLIGQVVTLSYYVRVGSNYSGTFASSISYHDNSNYPNDGMYYFNFRNAGSTYENQKYVAVNTSWQRVEHTIAIPSTTIQIGVGFGAPNSQSATAGSNDYFEITGVQLELGSKATVFERRQISHELQLCQRYYNVTSNMWMSGLSYSSSGVDGLVIPFRFPVEMRANPTISFSSGNDGGSIAALFSGGVSTSHVNINLRSTSGNDNFVWFANFTTTASAEM